MEEAMKMIELMELREQVERYYEMRVCASVLIDPEKKMHLESMADELKALYINMANCSIGDYQLAMEHFVNEGYAGFVLDNIDEIPDSVDAPYWEWLVRWALKREDRCSLCMTWGRDMVVDFSNVGVIVRCSEFPEYLRGRDLQALYFEV